MPLVTTEGLLGCLELDAPEPGRFVGANMMYPGDRVFGGQILAQLVAVAAAASTGKRPRSAHVVFCREGTLDEDVSYSVVVEKAGRTMDDLTVRVEQGSRLLALAVVSTVADGGGFDHRPDRPDRPGPDASTPIDLQLVPWETRVCPGCELSQRESVEGRYAFWMNASGLTAAPWHGAALVAHVSDLTLIATALLPLDGWSIDDAHHGLVTAVASHSIWFHRPFDLDDWVLIEQRVTAVHGETAVADGEAWSSDGRLLATYRQESLLRVAPGRH